MDFADNPANIRLLRTVDEGEIGGPVWCKTSNERWLFENLALGSFASTEPTRCWGDLRVEKHSRFARYKADRAAANADGVPAWKTLGHASVIELEHPAKPLATDNHAIGPSLHVIVLENWQTTQHTPDLSRQIAARQKRDFS